MSGIDQRKIRNFCIIAHIHHGKSTLATRIIEMTDFLQNVRCSPRYWTIWSLKENGGITIKSQAVRIV